MTPPPTPPPSFPEPDELDLAASDLIDGDAHSDPASHVAPAATGSPTSDGGPEDALAQRVARLRPAVEALQEPVRPPAPSIRDQQIARALAQPSAATAAAAAASRVDGFPASEGVIRLEHRDHLDGHRRSDRVGPARRGPVVLAVAAAVLVLALGAALVVAYAGSSSRTHPVVAATAGTSPDARSPADHGGRPAGASAGASSVAPTTGSGGDLSLTGLSNLGSASDAAGLATLVQRRQAASATGAAREPQSAQAAQVPSSPSLATTTGGCEARVRAALGRLGPLSLRARATLADRPVEILVFAAGPSPEVARLVAADPQTCEVLVDRPG